jgi:hypothetical protein
MFKWLKRFWDGPVVATTTHPFFGTMELTRIRGEESWDADSVPFADRTISVYVNTVNSEIPSKQQIAFFHRATNDQTAMLEQSASVLVPAYERIYGPLKGSLSDTFELVGIGVPLDADASDPWLLQFETVGGRYALFTIHFKNGVAARYDHDT